MITVLKRVTEGGIWGQLWTILKKKLLRCHFDFSFLRNGKQPRPHFGGLFGLRRLSASRHQGSSNRHGKLLFLLLLQLLSLMLHLVLFLESLVFLLLLFLSVICCCSLLFSLKLSLFLLLLQLLLFCSYIFLQRLHMLFVSFYASSRCCCCLLI